MTRPLAAIALLLLAGCGKRVQDGEPADPGFIQVPCTPDQPAPYPSGMPYVGIHANAQGNDRVGCEVHDAFAQDWHALKGHAVMQPAILSPDGRTVYVTATNPEPDGCTLFALDAESGEETWCVALPFDVVASAPEVDEDGRIYLSAGGEAQAFEPDGAPLWSTRLWPGPDRPADEDLDQHTGYGVHFSGDDLVTVTAAGRVVVLDRATGAERLALDIPTEFGLVPPPAGALSGFDLVGLLPPEIVANVEAIFGDRAGGALGSFFGAGENFSDNTIAAHDGRFYVVGGGPTEESGALVQVRERQAGTGESELYGGWYTVTRPGSAATPSVSADGRWVVTSDGTATRSLMSPDQADAAIVAVDIEACDAQALAAGEIVACEPAWEYPLRRGAMPGAPALADDGTVWFWEMSMSMDGDPTARDLIAVNADGVQLEVTLPEGREWTSVITLTDNYVVGGTSTITPSDTLLAGITVPAASEHELVVIDRTDGALVYAAPIPDDCAATVSVGPDGSLYVGMLGLVSMLSLDEPPTLGLIRFRPVEG